MKLVRLGFDACATLQRHLRHEFFEVAMSAHFCLSFVTARTIGYLLFADKEGQKSLLFRLCGLDTGGEEFDEFGAVVAKGGEGLV